MLPLAQSCLIESLPAPLPREAAYSLPKFFLFYLTKEFVTHHFLNTYFEVH